METCYFNTDYRGLNYNKILNKSNELISKDSKKEIFEKLEKEKNGYQLFRKNLNNIIKGEMKND